MRTLLFDLRYGARQLRKAPGLALLAIVTLALGIGANTAVFTVIESVLLRPLPYAHADRLVNISPGADAQFGNTSWLNYRDIRAQSKLLRDVGGYAEDVSVLVKADSSQSVAAPHVAPNLLSMLGVPALLGRTFTEKEGESGGPGVVLLSEGLWRQSFGADPNIVGQAVNIGGRPHTVVGVMPGGFRFPESMGPDMGKGVWLPLQPTAEMLKDRGYNFFSVLGGLRPGVATVQAQHELDAIAAHIPPSESRAAYAFRAMPYQEVLTGPVRPVLYALLGALALVLLIACANVSNLLIARCLARRQEFAVRAALGAARMRLLRQMLAEGLLLSLLGSGAGVILAEGAIEAVRSLPDGTIPLADTIAIRWTIVIVLAAVAMATTILSSLVPALLTWRSDPQAVLQTSSRGVVAHSAGARITHTLVAGEVALSALLLVGTGLLFHTLWNLTRTRLGFETAHVTEFMAMPADAAGFSGLAVSEDHANAPASVATLVYQPVLGRIRAVPGVESAALITAPPLAGMDLNSSFEIVSEPRNPGIRLDTRLSAVSDEYARTMGTPLLAGRTISNADGAAAPFVAVINTSFARQYFRGRAPLGRQINLGGQRTGMLRPYTIVGVLADQVDRSVGAPVQPFLLLSQQQIPTTSLFYQALLKTVVYFVVRTHRDLPVAAEMRSIFHQAAPGFALDNFETLQEAVEKSTFSQRLGLYLVGSFAGLAVAMVFGGLYGVLFQLVAYRRREIGMRMALGASRRSVAQLILRQGSILIASGLAAGLLLALAAGRLVKSFLYQVQPLDLPTYAAVAVGLSTIGLIAVLIPAHKAASIDPMQALRED
jgi:predicted permease